MAIDLRPEAERVRAASKNAERRPSEPGAAPMNEEKQRRFDAELKRSDPDGVLDRLVGFLRRFVVYPSADHLVAHALWILHTHLMGIWESTPRIAFLSPEPASGKTRALEVTELLVPNPIQAVNVSPAYLFRKVGGDGNKPTILFDEIDSVFGPKARENEEIRGLLNAGHRRGAVAGRCVVRGKVIETEEIPAYSAIALAGLGDLPDTLLSRSVVVRMRRRAPREEVEAFRRRVHGPEGDDLRLIIEAWADEVQDWIGDLPWPVLPTGIDDRDADLWEPLLSVAEAVGGIWPDRARVAAVALVADSKASRPSLGIRLLSDLQAVFADRSSVPTEEILATLNLMDEAPWGELQGKPLNARGLANRLRNYGVSPKNLRVPGGVVKGYAREDLFDAWQRYLPVGPTPLNSATAATPATEPDKEATSKAQPSGDILRGGRITT